MNTAMKAAVCATLLALCIFRAAAADNMALSVDDLGLNSCNAKELAGIHPPKPNLPALDTDTVIGWLKSSVKLESRQIADIQKLSAKARTRAERFKGFVAQLQSFSDQMDSAKNKRDLKLLQDQAKEVKESFLKEFPMTTSQLTCNPLADLQSWIDPLLTDEQRPVWKDTLLKKFVLLSSSIRIEKKNGGSMDGRLLALKSDYDFSTQKVRCSYLVYVNDKAVVVAPDEVAIAQDKHETVVIALSKN